MLLASKVGRLVLPAQREERDVVALLPQPDARASALLVYSSAVGSESVWHALLWMSMVHPTDGSLKRSAGRVAAVRSSGAMKRSSDANDSTCRPCSAMNCMFSCASYFSMCACECSDVINIGVWQLRQRWRMAAKPSRAKASGRAGFGGARIRRAPSSFLGRAGHLAKCPLERIHVVAKGVRCSTDLQLAFHHALCHFVFQNPGRNIRLGFDFRCADPCTLWQRLFRVVSVVGR